MQSYDYDWSGTCNCKPVKWPGVFRHMDPKFINDDDWLEFNNNWNKQWCEHLLYTNGGFGSHYGTVECTPKSTTQPSTGTTRRTTKATTQATTKATTKATTTKEPDSCPSSLEELCLQRGDGHWKFCDCYTYTQCWGGGKHHTGKLKCPEGTIWDSSIKNCNWKIYVKECSQCNCKDEAAASQHQNVQLKMLNDEMASKSNEVEEPEEPEESSDYRSAFQYGYSPSGGKHYGHRRPKVYGRG